MRLWRRFPPSLPRRLRRRRTGHAVADRAEVRMPWWRACGSADDRRRLRPALGSAAPEGARGRAGGLHLSEPAAERELRHRHLRLRHRLGRALDRDRGLPRATFAPRVPGYGFDRIGPVYPVGACGPAGRPGVRSIRSVSIAAPASTASPRKADPPLLLAGNTPGGSARGVPPSLPPARLRPRAPRP
jgi:hypothetical protein